MHGKDESHIKKKNEESPESDYKLYVWPTKKLNERGKNKTT